MKQEALERLMGILDAHHAVDEKEAADVKLIRQLVLANPDIFSRDCFPGHITGSALVLDLENGRILLHYHKTLAKWLQFGGHAEEEVNPADIAWREATEESGLSDLEFFPIKSSPRPIDIDVHAIPARGSQTDHLHLDFRYLLATESTTIQAVNTAESDRFRWISFDDSEPIEGEIDEGLLRLINKARTLYGRYATGTREDGRRRPEGMSAIE